MKLEMELGGQQTQELRLFADAVLWRGEALNAEFQGRMMLDDMVPDPGDRCLELQRLTVMDECACAHGACIEFDQCGGARAVGRLEIPLEAEFRDEEGNTYFSKATANYGASIDAEGLTREDCGEVVLHCIARELTVQAVSRECVNYLLKLDVHAYLARRALVKLELEEEEPEPATGPVLVRETGFTRMPSAGSQPVMGDMARRMTSHSGCTLDSLAAGAARSCSSRPPRAEQEASADSAPAMEERMERMREEAMSDPEDDDDAYRTIVKMPVHRHRR